MNLKELTAQIASSTIQKRPVAALIPYAMNSRKHEDWQVAKIAASIREFGWTNPVLIDEQGTIIAGHARVMAAAKLEIADVPCIVLGHLTSAQRRAYVIADNRLSELASWNIEFLAPEIEALKDQDYNIELTGFDDASLNELFQTTSDDGTATGSGGDDDNPYSKNVEPPIYKPTGEKPDESELFNSDKTEKLLAEIKAADIPEKIKKVLRFAAHRHTVFNYQNMAEYYAHAPKGVQELMENSALVIIDFGKAIEQGFIQLADKIAEEYLDEGEE